jgi:hypothetical protein
MGPNAMIANEDAWIIPLALLPSLAFWLFVFLYFLYRAEIKSRDNAIPTSCPNCGAPKTHAGKESEPGGVTLRWARFGCGRNIQFRASRKATAIGHIGSAMCRARASATKQESYK